MKLNVIWRKKAQTSEWENFICFRITPSWLPNRKVYNGFCCWFAWCNFQVFYQSDQSFRPNSDQVPHRNKCKRVLKKRKSLKSINKWVNPLKFPSEIMIFTDVFCKLMNRGLFTCATSEIRLGRSKPKFLKLAIQNTLICFILQMFKNVACLLKRLWWKSISNPKWYAWEYQSLYCAW